MNDREITITDAQLDKLVDGELSAGERSELLAALEARGDGWRRCALSFLEAQAWRQQLCSFVKPIEPAERGLAAAARAALNERSGQGAPATAGPRWQAAGRWLAVAAAVLMAFVLGRQGSDPGLPIEAGGQVAQGPAPPVELPATGDIVTLVTNGPDGVPQRIRVPLVEARELGRQFAEQPRWSSSPELVRRLDERGLGLVARRRYVPMYFEQQNQRIPMVVPVDDAVITPVSRPVY